METFAVKQHSQNIENNMDNNKIKARNRERHALVYKGSVSK